MKDGEKFLNNVSKMRVVQCLRKKRFRESPIAFALPLTAVYQLTSKSRPGTVRLRDVTLKEKEMKKDEHRDTRNYIFLFVRRFAFRFCIAFLYILCHEEHSKGKGNISVLSHVSQLMRSYTCLFKCNQIRKC